MLGDVFFSLLISFTFSLFFGAGFYRIVDLAVCDFKPELESQWKILLTLSCIFPLCNLFLYYLLLLFHGFQDIFYILSICLFFLLIVFTAFRFRVKKIVTIYLEWFRICFSRKYLIVFFCVSIVSVIYCSIKRLTEFDYIEYGVQGKIFYLAKSIIYRKDLYDPISGFYFVGLHGYTFPLYNTLNLLLNKIFHKSSDIIFRQISSIYAFFTIFLMYSGIRSFNNKRAWVPVLFLILSPGFIIISLRFHIDTYRLFFTLVSFLLFYILVCHPDNMYLSFLFGIVLGFNSTAHSIGFIMSVIILLVFCIFIFLQSRRQKDKLVICGLPVLISLLSGGIHYLLDIFIGTGWIFKSINFY